MLIHKYSICELGLSEVVTVVHRDIQTLGFPDTFKSKVHGVFLDLPEPWKVGYNLQESYIDDYIGH